KGNVRWTLPRPGVRRPAWTGTRTDTRIAYLSGGSLRVVAGDGTGDRLLAEGAVATASWRPGGARVLAFAHGDVVEVDAIEPRHVLWRARLAAPATRLEWSSDGSRLLAVAHGVVVYDEHGRVVSRDDPSDAT